MTMPKMNRSHKILQRISRTKITSQWIMVTSYDHDYKPVNYLVNPKASGQGTGYTFARFLTDFPEDIQVEWVTVYETGNTMYQDMTYYVMCIDDGTDNPSTLHAIPMFSDMSLEYNKIITKQKSLYSVIQDRSRLTEEEYELIDTLQIIDDCFALATHYANPKRNMMMTIITGQEFETKRYLEKSFTLLQLVEGKYQPLAFLPISFKNKFSPEGQKEIMTDFEVFTRILSHMKYPY